jgi:hypothetical protein
LAQARIGKMFAQRIPQPIERAHRQHVAHPGKADLAHHGKRRGRLVAAQERRFEHVENALRFAAEVAIAARGGSPCKIADGIFTAQRIGKQIEIAAFIPGMAGDDFGRLSGDAIIKACPAGGKYLVKHFAQGEDGRPAVDLGTVHRNAPRLAADPGFLFADRDLRAARSQQGGAGKPANPCPNHDDSRAHCLSQPLTVTSQGQYH